MISKRMNSIHSSGIREVFDLAAKIKNPINLSIGQPDFPTPTKIKNAMIKAIKDNKTNYTQSQGIKKLREQILKKLRKKGIKCEDIILTSGVSGGLFLTYSVLLDKNDEMIIFDPYFVIYPDMCEFLGAKAKIVKTNKDFSINFERLEKSINKKTKAIMINTPNNPTGYVMNEAEIKKLAKLAKKHNLWIFSDEIYEDFVYNCKHISIGKYYDKVLILNGFSKKFSLPGLRLGYVAGPKKIINKLTQLQQYTFVCPPSLTQYGLINNLNINIKKNIKEYKERADLVYKLLKPHFDLIKPKGAFYIYVKTPKGIKASDFVKKCIKNKVLIIPSNVFSKEDTHFRISFATNKKNLIKGIKKIIKVKERLTKTKR